jgi:hypothetical protein
MAKKCRTNLLNRDLRLMRFRKARKIEREVKPLAALQLAAA